MQGTAQLRIVTVIALVAVLPAHGLRFTAGGAEELYMRQITTRYQTAQHTHTAARERASLCASLLLSFIFFMWRLTVVGIVNASAAHGQQRSSLHTAQHTQQVSAQCMTHAMHKHSVQVAA